MNFNRLIEIGKALYDPKNHSSRCYHLSAIYFKNKLIVLAENHARTHTNNLKNPKFGFDGRDISSTKGSCSEMLAVTKFKNKTSIPFNRCVLVNIRINKLNEITNSAPCPSCQSLLRNFKFKSVYFTDNNGVFQQYS